MALKTHITELMKRHQKIESALHDTLLHPSSDDMEIRALKQQKLKLKDQINALQANIRQDNLIVEAA